MNELFQPLDLSHSVANIRLADVIKKRKVWEKQLSGSTPYQFCPLCLKDKHIRIKDLKKYFTLKEHKRKKTDEELSFIQNIEHSGIQPLFQARYKELVKVSETMGEIMFNDYYECRCCQKEITMDDFIRFYCEPPRDNTLKKFVDLQNEQDLLNF